MRNLHKVLGISAIGALVMVLALGLIGCKTEEDEKGGTLTIKNSTTGKFVAYAVSDAQYKSDSAKIEQEGTEKTAYTYLTGTSATDGTYWKVVTPGQTKSWSFSDNTTVYYGYVYINGTNVVPEDDKVSISGGITRPVNVGEQQQ